VTAQEVREAYRASHVALHWLWGEAKSKPDYDKAPWIELSNNVDRIALAAASAAGYSADRDGSLSAWLQRTA
jgi:hypothetical protein